MVCSRCKMLVQAELTKFGLNPIRVELGEVIVSEELNQTQKKQLNHVLLSFGFVLIDDKKSRIIEKIKNAIVELVHYSEEQLKTNLSEHISHKLNHDYNYLSNLFSEVESTTIEQYFILQKIEKVKELLVYDELSLSEIALQMNYSSVSYLSKQFKNHHLLQATQRKKTNTNRRTLNCTKHLQNCIKAIQNESVNFVP